MTRTYFLAVIGFLVLSGCERQASSPENAEPKNQPTAQLVKGSVTLRPESLPYVTVREIKPETFSANISAPARVDFRTQAISSAGTLVSGRVNKIHVQVGDKIKEGAPLATLISNEAAQIRTDYTRTAAELARAADRVKRQRVMNASGVGIEIERVEAETQLKQAQAEFKRSEDFLNLLGDGNAGEVILRAPIDSTVLKAYVSTGAVVEPGAPLFDLGEPSAAWIIADVFEKDLWLVEKGAKATIELTSFPDPIIGHVIGESAAIQADLRRASVFIGVDNPRIALRPGMYARVNIEAYAPEHIILPIAAILIKDGKNTIVYVETSPGCFSARPVQVGQAHNGMIPILKGLNSGDRVVVSGALLIDGEAALLL